MLILTEHKKDRQHTYTWNKKKKDMLNFAISEKLQV